MRSCVSPPVALLLVLVFHSAVNGAQLEQSGASALKRLGYFLQSENRQVRTEFATIALEKMIAAYETELEELSAPGSFSQKELRKRMRWAKAVNQYLDYLYAFDEIIKQAPLVEIIADQPGPLQLLSGEFLLPVTTPRIARPEQLENDIIQAFCHDYPCDPRALEDPAAQPPASRLHSGWSFRAGSGSIYQTADGLNFVFSNVRNKAAKEKFCLRISGQLRLLGDALALALRRGQSVDWQFLKLKPGVEGDYQWVLPAAHTPGLRLVLPELAMAPEVLNIAKPWIKARLEKERIEQYFRDADRLLVRLIQGAG